MAHTTAKSGGKVEILVANAPIAFSASRISSSVRLRALDRAVPSKNAVPAIGSNYQYQGELSMTTT